MYFTYLFSLVYNLCKFTFADFVANSMLFMNSHILMIISEYKFANVRELECYLILPTLSSESTSNSFLV
jgi:hypothetical protein